MFKDTSLQLQYPLFTYIITLITLIRMHFLSFHHISNVNHVLSNRKFRFRQTSNIMIYYNYFIHTGIYTCTLYMFHIHWYIYMCILKTICKRSINIKIFHCHVLITVEAER